MDQPLKRNFSALSQSGRRPIGPANNRGQRTGAYDGLHKRREGGKACADADRNNKDALLGMEASAIPSAYAGIWGAKLSFESKIITIVTHHRKQRHSGTLDQQREHCGLAWPAVAQSCRRIGLCRRWCRSGLMICDGPLCTLRGAGGPHWRSDFVQYIFYSPSKLAFELLNSTHYRVCAIAPKYLSVWYLNYQRWCWSRSLTAIVNG